MYVFDPPPGLQGHDERALQLEQVLDPLPGIGDRQTVVASHLLLTTEQKHPSSHFRI